MLHLLRSFKPRNSFSRKSGKNHRFRDCFALRQPCISPLVIFRTASKSNLSRYASIWWMKMFLPESDCISVRTSAQLAPLNSPIMSIITISQCRTPKLFLVTPQSDGCRYWDYSILKLAKESSSMVINARLSWIPYYLREAHGGSWSADTSILNEGDGD